MAYGGDSNADRAKALALVAGIHVALGAALVSGLAGNTVREVTESLKSFDVVEPSPPPIEEPPPSPAEEAPEEEAAPPAERSEPAPVVAPPAPLPVPSPVPASELRAPTEGRDRTAGASTAGPGTGAGGAGSGFGGGGSGGAGNGNGGGIGAEARLVSGGLRRSDYRAIQAFNPPAGSARLSLSVGPEGRLTGCQVANSSGDPRVDQALCNVMLTRSRWSPARDTSGRPISVRLYYVATWNRF